MFGKNSFIRSWTCQFLTTALLITGMTVSAAPPAWWSQVGGDGHKVVDPLVVDPNPRGPANIGQAKYTAKRALGALQPGFSSTAASIETDLVGAGKIIPTWDVPAAGSALAQSQRAPLLVGQLKAIATPFYHHLYKLDPAWLEIQLRVNQTKDSSDSANYFPWTSATIDDSNKAIATVGQLKAAFSLRFETFAPPWTDADSDGLPDSWEIMHFAGLGMTAGGDPDDDGMLNALELLAGRNPAVADPVADASVRKLDVFNLSAF